MEYVYTVKATPKGGFFFIKGRGRKKFKGLPTVSQISSNFVIHGSVCTDLVLKKNGLKNCRFAVTMMFRAMQYEK
jgi:hypothetical protein